MAKIYNNTCNDKNTMQKRPITTVRCTKYSVEVKFRHIWLVEIRNSYVSMKMIKNKTVSCRNTICQTEEINLRTFEMESHFMTKLY